MHYGCEYDGLGSRSVAYVFGKYAQALRWCWRHSLAAAADLEKSRPFLMEG